MLSNLASYIFGSAEEVEVRESISHSPPTGGSEEEGWVLVGTPARDLNLGSIHDIPGSLLSSDDETEVASEGRLQGQPLPPNSSSGNTIPAQASSLPLTRSKAVSAAQHALQRKTKKALSGKVLERQNKAVKMSSACKKQAGRLSFPIKSSGINKQLKQC